MGAALPVAEHQLPAVPAAETLVLRALALAARPPLLLLLLLPLHLRRLAGVLQQRAEGIHVRTRTHTRTHAHTVTSLRSSWEHVTSGKPFSPHFLFTHPSPVADQDDWLRLRGPIPAPSRSHVMCPAVTHTDIHTLTLGRSPRKPLQLGAPQRHTVFSLPSQSRL